MNGNIRLRLSVMMFLQYAFNGIWIIPLGTYMNRVGYSGMDIGAAYSTFAIGCILAPYFVGMIADKFFAAQKILGVLNLAAAGILLLAPSLSVGPDGRALVSGGQTGLGAFYWVLLAHFVCYMPTWALTNTIALRQMDNPAGQFPGIRVMGTLGWIAVSAVTLFGESINGWLGRTEPFEATATPMYIGAALGGIAGLASFFMPATPPAGRGQRITAADIAGVKALALFKDRDYAVFALTSFLIMFAGMFYWNWANVYLNESGMKFAQFWQSSGQMSETVFLVVMPWFFRRLGVKKMLLVGLCAWIARFACFSTGAWGTATAALVVLGLALHGPCYDFFFVTGQLYTDRKAGKEIQAQAQGMISFITFGLGWFSGSMLAGWLVERHAVRVAAEAGAAVGAVTGHRWHDIWLWPIGIVAVILLFFGILFRDNTVVGSGKDGAPGAS
jgi:nucleoside transporter